MLLRPNLMKTEISFQPQSRTNVVGTVKLDHVTPCPLINVGKCRGGFFFNKKGKNHLIVNTVSEGRGELASGPNVFVWDCS